MGSRKRILAAMIILVFAATLAAGCGSGTTTTTTTDSSSKVIKIATVTPLSGSQAALGESIKLGAQLAFEERKGELEALGFQPEFAPQDDQADPKVGVTVANKLIADKDVLAVDGHYNSGVAIPSSEVYAKDNLCMVSPGNTAVEITERGLANVNRICSRDDKQGPFGAKFAAQDLQAKSVFIIHDKTTYGQAIADEFKKQAEKEGMTVAGYEGITAGESDFSGVLNQVSAATPDVVYFGGIYPEGSLLIKQMKEKGISSKFIGPDGMDDAEVVKIAGEAAIGTYYTSPAADISRTPEGKAFAEKYLAKFGKEPGNWSAYGYDAMNICIDGIIKAIKDNGGKKPSRQQVSEAVRGLKDVKGITSTVTFDEKGDNLGAMLYLAEFKEAVYPPEVIKEIKASDFQN